MKQEHLAPLAELNLDVSLMIWLFFRTEEEMLGEIFLQKRMSPV